MILNLSMNFDIKTNNFKYSKNQTSTHIFSIRHKYKCYCYITLERVFVHRHTFRSLGLTLN